MDDETTQDSGGFTEGPFDEPFGDEFGYSPNGHGLGALVKEITLDLSNLVRKEVQLAKQEVTELVRTKLLAAGLFIIAGVLGILIVPFLLLTLVEVIAIWVPRWGASLIVTGLMVVAAAIAVMVAKKKFDSRMTPEKTIQSLKEDVEWAKHLKR